MHIREFQQLIETLYYDRDKSRGREATFCWFVEEVGELAEAVRKGNDADMREEFADVAAWLVTLASIAGVDLEDAALAKYGTGCPRCRETPCACPEA
jgi:NTP pyrophosphatase (non-canonical NTP hydrolase)